MAFISDNTDAEGASAHITAGFDGPGAEIQPNVSGSKSLRVREPEGEKTAKSRCFLLETAAFLVDDTGLEPVTSPTSTSKNDFF